MSNMDCGCRTGCTGLAVVASIIIGIITTFLVFSGTITITPAFLWVTFGIAIAALGLTLIIASRTPRCICSVLKVLITGILGTILASLILLAVAFGTASVVGAVISGALLLFFTLIITSAACLVNCIAGCSE